MLRNIRDSHVYLGCLLSLYFHMKLRLYVMLFAENLYNLGLAFLYEGRMKSGTKTSLFAHRFELAYLVSLRLRDKRWYVTIPLVSFLPSALVGLDQ